MSTNSNLFKDTNCSIFTFLFQMKQKINDNDKMKDEL